MTNVVLSILFALTSAKITLSRGEIGENEKITTEEELRLIIEQSIICDCDFSPFLDPHLDISNKELEDFQRNNYFYNEITYDHVWTRIEKKKRDEDEIIKTVSYSRISKSVVKKNGEIVNQFSSDNENKIYKRFTKSENGEIMKIIEDPNLLTFITKNENFLEVQYTSQNFESEITERCMKTEYGDIIKTTFHSEDEFTETSILQKTGEWFWASGKSKTILMDSNNYYNSLKETDYQNVNIKGWILKKGYLKITSSLLDITEDNFIGNDLYVELHHDDWLYSKRYYNYGIINNDYALLIDARFHECSQITNATTLGPEFEDITNYDRLSNFDNINFLVYATPEGKKFRTSNAEIIKKSRGQ